MASDLARLANLAGSANLTDYTEYDDYDVFGNVLESKTNQLQIMLKNLLLNEFDNNLFFDFASERNYYSNKNEINIIGIKNPYYYNNIINKDTQVINELFLGIKNIYIIHNTYKKHTNNLPLLKKLQIPTYILESKLPIKFIKCNLSEFAELYPEFIDNKFTDDEQYYSFANSLNGEIYSKSCRCDGLIGANILPNLIIGQSFDFDRYFNSSGQLNSYKKEFDKYCIDTINDLKLNNVNCIINVYMSHNKTYPKEAINILNNNGIDVYSFPLDESSTNSNENLTNFYQAAEMLNANIVKGKKVYLHCYVGKNRSISVGLLYMVKYLKIPLKLACEEIYLKKTYAPQIKFICEIWKQAKANGEEYPIALCKIISDATNIGNTYSLYGLGFYDVHKLDIIAGRKTLPLINDYKKIKPYIEPTDCAESSDIINLYGLNVKDNKYNCLIN